MPFIVIFSILAMPFLEIWAFITIGGGIGAGKTILLSLMTGLLGITLIRIRGMKNINKMRDNIKNKQMPIEQALSNVLTVIAGVLMIIPGFITDILGSILFIPVIQKYIYSSIKNHPKTIIKEEYSSKTFFTEQKKQENKTIDADYKNITDE